MKCLYNLTRIFMRYLNLIGSQSAEFCSGQQDIELDVQVFFKPSITGM